MSSDENKNLSTLNPCDLQIISQQKGVNLDRYIKAGIYQIQAQKQYISQLVSERDTLNTSAISRNN